MPTIPYKRDPTPIGRGAYATVWRGTHRVTGEVAAVKCPHRNDDEALRRFRREVEVQSNLDHPNIMPIIEHSIEGRWFAMPLAEYSLTDRIDKYGPINGYALIPIVRELVSGLAHAHRQNYIHRDFNPNNILELRDEDGSRWVIADWGLVHRTPRKDSPRLTRRGLPLGTEGFTAPEAESNPLVASPTHDVYSLGRVVHFALTGVWPRRSFPMPQPGWLWSTFVAACTAAYDKRAVSMRACGGLLRGVEEQSHPRHVSHDVIEVLLCPRCEIPIFGARCVRCGRMWD